MDEKKTGFHRFFKVYPALKTGRLFDVLANQTRHLEH